MERSKVKISKVISAAVMSFLMMLMLTVSAFATPAGGGSAGVGQGMDSLSTYVYSKMAANTYEVTGGGSISGQDVFYATSYQGVQGGQGGFDVDEKKFATLTSSAQTQFVSDIATYSNQSMTDSTYTAGSNISEETVQAWWKTLQSKNGLGSKFLNVILENTKPDFVTANAIYKPFSGIVGTVLGLIAVIGMALLGLVMVSDIFYIVIPPVRMMVSEETVSGVNGAGGRKSSKLFSDDAMYAVKVAEEQDDAGGSKKQALGIYLKRRVPMLILLGICLLYLVSGQIYTFVGWILDLVSGFLGF